jgi:enoyl-CoA hydratase/carnithine racemase
VNTAPDADPLPTVLTRQQGAVRVVSLNRPKRLNAITIDLLRALNAALAEAQADPSVRAIVLRGEGRAFCAGDDLVAQLAIGPASAAALRPFVDELQQVTRHLMLGDKPVVGLVHGWAVGGGFSWTLNCDLTLWAQTARARLPEVGFGMFVSGGLSLLLPRAAGRMAAAEITWMGAPLDTARLQALGVAWRVVPDDVLLSEGMALAAQLADLPEHAARQLKRSLLAPDRQALEAALDFETEACVAAVGNPQTLARISNFMAAAK